MKTEYRIEAVRFYTDQPTHIKLQETVQPLLDAGWKLLGAPFFGPEMMYQALQRETAIPVTP
jgi:hypothetical protein